MIPANFASSAGAESAWFLLVLVVAGAPLAAFWLLRRCSQQAAEIAWERRLRVELAGQYEAAVQDRERMAADLHDALAQSLAAVSFQLEAGESLLEDDLERSRRHLFNARSLLSQTREEVRRTVTSLRTHLPAGATLAEALRELAEAQSAGRSTRIRVDYQLEAYPLPNCIAGNLMLLAREAISNAVRHSDARAVMVRVRIFGRSLEFSVTDDGCGFDVSAAPGVCEGHFGLQGMRERVARLGGTLRIESAPGRGTQIVARVDIV